MNNYVSFSGLIEDEKREEDLIREYEKYMKEKKILRIRFSMCDSGNVYKLIKRSNGVEYSIIMKPEDMRKSGTKTTQRRIDLEREYPVMVKSVDAASHTICVSSLLAREAMAVRLCKAIEQGFKNDTPVRSKARILGISANHNGQKFLELDIAGCGVKGYLFRDDWSPCYTSDVSAYAVVGDVINVEITDILQPKRIKKGDDFLTDGTNFVYRCSRKNTIDIDPWNGIEEKYPVGTVVTVTCIDKNQANFFGKIDGLDEINAVCGYPEEGVGFVSVGSRYMARVKIVDEKKKKLIIKPFKLLQ